MIRQVSFFYQFLLTYTIAQHEPSHKYFAWEPSPQSLLSRVGIFSATWGVASVCWSLFACSVWGPNSQCGTRLAALAYPPTG
eukprot:4522857-Amphidinium_carterae.3